MVRLFRSARMLDFGVLDGETHLLVLMERGSCLVLVALHFSVYYFWKKSCLVLTSLGVFIAHGGGVHTVK